MIRIYIVLLKIKYGMPMLKTLLTSYIDAEVEGKEPVTLKNIIVYSNDIRTNAKYAESDWAEKNKIQTVELTLTCQTWLVRDTPPVIKTPRGEHLRWSVTKKVLLDFAGGAGLIGKTHGKGDVVAEAQKVVWQMFDGV